MKSSDLPVGDHLYLHVCDFLVHLNCHKLILDQTSSRSLCRAVKNDLCNLCLFCSHSATFYPLYYSPACVYWFIYAADAINIKGYREH